MREHNEEESKLDTSVTRRKFLAFTGLAAAGLAAGPLLKNVGGTTAVSTAVSGAASAAANRNVEAARSLLQAFNTGDVQVVDNLVHRTIAAYGKQVKQNIADTRRAFPNARFTEDEIVAEGDRVILRWNMTGTHSGTLLGAQATGKQIRTIGYEVLRFQNGKIVEYTNGLATTRFETLSKLGLLNQEMAERLASYAA